MPTVTINVAAYGTPLNNGGTSLAGHMWYELNNNGVRQSYGFAPIEHGVASGPGKTYTSDSDSYKSYDSHTVEISQQQHDAMSNFGENPGSGGFDMQYNGANNSCIDFTWKALEVGGLNPSGFNGELWPSHNLNEIRDIPGANAAPGNSLGYPALSTPKPGSPYPGSGDGPFPGGPGGPYSPFGGMGFGDTPLGVGFAAAMSALMATVAPFLDPLALDLDDDGIETTNTSNGRPILFDHDGDGILTGTGWLKPDDGWLALDLNSNNLIENGSELFGVYTKKSDGTFASDGFDALSNLDENHDGIINAGDRLFNQLLVWRDLNQDGINQVGENKSLKDSGISSFSLTMQKNSIDLGNGNVQTGSGTYTRVNGGDGVAGIIEGKSLNLDLVVNTFFREFTTKVELSPATATLPNISGSGMVRDLREAASLSEELAGIISQYMAADSKSTQTEILDQFVSSWADTSSMKPLSDQAILLSDSGVTLRYVLAGIEEGSYSASRFLDKLGIVERFVGFTYGGPTGQAKIENLSPQSGNISVTLAREQIAHIEEAYEQIKTDVGESLRIYKDYSAYLTTLLGESQLDDFATLEQMFSSTMENDNIDGVADFVEFVSAIGINRLEKLGWNPALFLGNELSKFSDIKQFSADLRSWNIIIGAENTLIVGSGKSDVLMSNTPQVVINSGDGNDILAGFTGDDTLNGGSGNDILIGGAGNDLLNGGDGSDSFLFRKDFGHDTLIQHDLEKNRNDSVHFLDYSVDDIQQVVRNGDNLVITFNSLDQLTLAGFYSHDYWWSKIDEIRFKDGLIWDRDQIMLNTNTYGSDQDDVLYGIDSGSNRIDAKDGSDHIYGGHKSDVLIGGDGADFIYGRDGDDVIIGGTGDDVLSGDQGSDQFIFGKKFGNDSIIQDDISKDRSDVIRFDSHTSSEISRFERRDSDLVIGFGEGEILTVKNYYFSEGIDSYKIDFIEFSDGTIWDRHRIKEETLTIGTDRDDLINGYQDVSNKIFGRAGDDRITGGDNDDVIDGEAGNDVINGGKGNDTFIFQGQFGHDIINQDDSSESRSDIVKFTDRGLESVSSIEQIGTDLVLRFTERSSTTFKNYFHGDEIYKVDRFEFFDGDFLDHEAILKSAITHGTDGDDFIISRPGSSNKIFSGSGDDRLQGRDFSDEFHGQSGNDTLWGGDGADNLFGGDGDDKLNGDDGNDQLSGGSGNDYLVGGTGGDTYAFEKGDDADVIDEYDSGIPDIDIIRFGAGISASDISLARLGESLVVSIGYGTDSLTVKNWASSSYYRIERFEFSDGTVWNAKTLSAKVSALPHTGSVGDDYLQGDSGPNVFQGGRGNDQISGGQGADIYIFERGDGSDVIDEFGYDSGEIDIIRFGTGIAASDIVVSRSGENLVLTIQGTTDNVVVKNWWASSYYHIEKVEFADGTTWDKISLEKKIASLPYVGTNGDDYLHGDSESNVFQGGKGDDEIDGGQGADVYLFERGDGKDTIKEFGFVSGELDIVRFGNGIAASQVIVSRAGDDLVLTIDGSADSVTIKNWSGGSYYHIEHVEFADGAIWNEATLIEKLAALPYIGTVGDDYLQGDSGVNVFQGGKGNDYLGGGQGADIYLFDRGDGKDKIDEFGFVSGEVDTIRFGAAIKASDIAFSRSGQDLVLSIAGTDESVTVSRWFNDTYYRIETVEFSDGTVWDETDLIGFIGLASNQAAIQ